MRNYPNRKLYIDKIQKQYRENGFTIVPNLIDSKSIELLNKACLSLQNFSKSCQFKTDLYDNARFVFQDKDLHRVVWAGGKDPTFLDIAHNSNYLFWINQLLTNSKATTLVQLINQVHFKLPGSKISFEWHQDAKNRCYGTKLWADLLGDGSYIQSALAIDPMNSTNGPLIFIKNSHLKGYLDSKEKILEEVSQSEQVVLNLNPGDVAFFHPFCIHGSHENTSSAPRRVLINGYTITGVNSKLYPGCAQGLPVSLTAHSFDTP